MAFPIISAAIRFIAGRAGGSAAGVATESAMASSASTMGKEAGNITKNIQKDIQDGAEEAVAVGAKILHAEVINSIKEAGAVASSQLLNSVTISSMQASTDSAVMTVGSSSPYAAYVEYGRRAGSKPPPMQAIFEWMTMKGMEADHRAAYAIAKKIGKDGIPPKRVFQRGVERAEPQIALIAPTIIYNKVTK